jgi:chaperone modulatory protein CbpM
MSQQSKYALARPYRLSLESYSRLVGVHPDMVRRLLRLGLLEVTRDAHGDYWFDPSQVRALGRIQRLHLELELSYGSLGLITDLLDRISELESAPRQRQEGASRWT